MMKDKERARLSVKPIDKSTFTYDFLGENTVWLDIENFGTTHALNVRATCDAVPIANGIIPENVERGYLLVPLFQIPSEPTRDQSRR
jgi:hypothetical protein